MTPDAPNPDEPSDEPSDGSSEGSSDESSDSPADRPRGLLEQIRAVIEALGEIEANEGGHRRASGRIDRGATRVDYGYDVSIGLGPGLGNRQPSRREDSDADPARIERISPETEDQKPAIHVETREVSDDELVVIADLPGVADDELDVTLDATGPALELTADGETIDRLEIDNPQVTIANVSLNNQILEVRLARSGDQGGGEPE